MSRGQSDWLVEAAGGDGRWCLHSVDLAAGTCRTCRATCAAANWAIDVVLHRGEASRWLIRSAFHKDLRRGDVSAARHWARWLAWCDGPAAPLRYLQRIWSEETWDLDLAVYLHSSAPSVALAITWFCRAPKVWQSEAWWAAWLDVASAVSPDDSPPPRDLRPVDRGFLTALGRALGSEDEPGACNVRARWMKSLVRRGHLDFDHASVLERRYRSGRYESEDVLLLLAARGQVPQCLPRPASAEAAPRELIHGRVLRTPPAYAYDYHSRAGLARMRAWLASGTGRAFRFGFDTSPIDLRWAGGPLPLFWRVLAWRQAGVDMDGVGWQEAVPARRELALFERVCPFWPENCL